MKSIIHHLVDKYSEALANVRYVDTFAEIVEKHKGNLDKHVHPQDSEGGATVNGVGRWSDAKREDVEEDVYFGGEEPTSAEKPLVAYIDEEAAALRGMQRSSSAPELSPIAEEEGPLPYEEVVSEKRKLEDDDDLVGSTRKRRIGLRRHSSGDNSMSSPTKKISISFGERPTPPRSSPRSPVEFSPPSPTSPTSPTSPRSPASPTSPPRPSPKSPNL